jgi:hypothetical protein
MNFRGLTRLVKSKERDCGRGKSESVLIGIEEGLVEEVKEEKGIEIQSFKKNLSLSSLGRFM